MAQLHFFGATHQVTGSQHLLELADGTRILVDCGTDMELFRKRNKELFITDPVTIDVVILTHAHIDHTGLLPLLVENGFDGPVYCTHATYQLVRILLRDAARLNVRKFGKKRMKPADYYDEKMVERIWDQFITVDFSIKHPLGNSNSFVFHPNGHLLGAAAITITWTEQNKVKSILFSGDIGHNDDPLLEDPEIPGGMDFMVCESTYGGRYHEDIGNAEEIILRMIRETCVDQPGRLIVPASSVGRTQVFLYLFNRLRRAGDLPPIPVFTDSPLARKSTAIYEDFRPYLNDTAREFGDDHGSLFDFDQVTYIADMDSAEQIQNYHEPCIILTSSGMVSGGKSEDHVLMNLQNPFCTILFIGFCAEGTLGHSLLQGRSSIRLGRELTPVNARIARTDALSGHADHNGLLEYVNIQKPDKLKKIFLVHGETGSMRQLADSLSQNGFHTEIPQRNESFTI